MSPRINPLLIKTCLIFIRIWSNDGKAAVPDNAVAIARSGKGLLDSNSPLDQSVNKTWAELHSTWCISHAPPFAIRFRWVWEKNMATLSEMGKERGFSKWQLSIRGNYGNASAESALVFPLLGMTTGSIPYRDGGIPIMVRCIEIAMALTALLLTAPIMIVIGIIIKMGTPGPALFFQKRVGQHGKPFTFVKFRTHYADAKLRFPELYAYQYSQEQLQFLHFKTENDPRVTPQGKWLRKSSLDELPNFWNLLTGDMSLVGPRPEIPEMLPYYDNEMLLKFAVRPGITGLAQISGRGRLSFYDTVRCDLEYVRKRSLGGDLRILIKTIHKIMVRDGAF